jgi:PKD repeat protein
VLGIVYEPDGVTPASDCIVNVTNTNTGEWALTTTVYEGWYMLSTEALGSYVYGGEVINVTATRGTIIGWGEGLAEWPYVQIDVTLSAPQTSYLLELDRGWNFVSFPLLNDSWMAGNVGLEYGSLVAGWDVMAQSETRFFVVGMTPPAYDFSLERGESFWIFSPHGQTLVLWGHSPDIYQQLSVACPAPYARYWISLGFNTLGSDINATDIPSMAVGVKVILVCRYNSPSGDYSNFLYGVTPPARDFVIMPGDGCWLLVEGAGSLVYSPSGSEAAPVASFEVVSSTYHTVTVDASGSYDSDGSIVSCHWDWGDDTQGTGMTSSHTYSTVKYRQISLTVTDDDGLTDSIVKIFPLEPLLIYGYVYNWSACPQPNTDVSVTHIGTGSFLNSTTDDGGRYEVDINLIQGGWQIGDVIKVQLNWTVPRYVWLSEENATGGSIQIDLVKQWGIPGPPCPVFGQTLDINSAPIALCAVTVSNLRTNESLVGVTDDIWGYFEFDLKSMPGLVMLGDFIRVSAITENLSASTDVLLTYYLLIEVGYIYVNLILLPAG